MFQQYLAIDPLALLLPGDVYANIVEHLHPHVPKVAEIEKALARLSPADRAAVHARARTLGAMAKNVETATQAIAA